MHKSRHRCTGLQEVWELRETLPVCGWADLPDVGNSALETIFSYSHNLALCEARKSRVKTEIYRGGVMPGEL